MTNLFDFTEPESETAPADSPESVNLDDSPLAEEVIEDIIDESVYGDEEREYIADDAEPEQESEGEIVAPSIAEPVDVMALGDAKAAFRHRLTLAGYRAIIGHEAGAWNESAARRACNALLGRPASDRPEPSIDDWWAASRLLRARSDDGFAPIPALEALMPSGAAA